MSEVMRVYRKTERVVAAPGVAERGVPVKELKSNEDMVKAAEATLMETIKASRHRRPADMGRPYLFKIFVRDWMGGIILYNGSLTGEDKYRRKISLSSEMRQLIARGFLIRCFGDIDGNEDTEREISMFHYRGVLGSYVGAQFPKLFFEELTGGVYLAARGDIKTQVDYGVRSFMAREGVPNISGQLNSDFFIVGPDCQNLKAVEENHKGDVLKKLAEGLNLAETEARRVGEQKCWPATVRASEMPLTTDDPNQLFFPKYKKPRDKSPFASYNELGKPSLCRYGGDREGLYGLYFKGSSKSNKTWPPYDGPITIFEDYHR
eukprot:GHVN01022290.1.p1 GENE.GHVN01022290.1~~GHVN01022290.1.p1  ORF type:complete len:320 (+),score=24.98 GHVN01022290.1:465-1424(+)